ncbi:MAG: histidine phosphatase family protein [Chlamydiia bacterium]|nr:histidine phosphatase family protein [Chlamydiia bacterium]
MAPKIILMRHGKSAWNQKNLFTGWVDIPLSEEGVRESVEGGRAFQDIPIDRIFTSTLIRSHMSLSLAMLAHKSGKIPVFLHPGSGKREEWGHIHSAEAKLSTIPVIQAWELNERMYGDLQGLNKAETVEKYGAEQVQVWRRSFATPPPHGESLQMTAERALPYFKKQIVPHVEKGETVFVCAHGNSLRSIVMHIEKLTAEQVLQLEIATGESLIYSYEKGQWKRC